VGERVAKHVPAAVAHMQGTGGIGGDVFDIDLFALPHGTAAVVATELDGASKLINPYIALQGEVNKTGTGDNGLFNDRNDP
jgi:hypothetical protein